MCHRCRNFNLHPHSLTTVSSKFFWKKLLLSKKRTNISPNLVGTQHVSSANLNPFCSSSKIMRGERLGNILHCVEEHLPLHWKTWKREGAMMRSQDLWSIRTSQPFGTHHLQVQSSLEDCMLIVPPISLDQGTLTWSFSLPRTEFFLRLFSTFFFDSTWSH